MPFSKKYELFDPANGIPTDVTFLVEEDTGDKSVEVKAHKMFLAAASSVFRNMFYGPARDTSDIIPVKETTKEAFETLVKFIYEVDIDWDSKNIIELFYLGNMAKKYLVDEMSDRVKDALARVPVSLDTVVQTAATALEFSQFEELSEALLTRCARFLKPHLPTPASCFRLAAEYSETELSGACLKLLGRLSSLQGGESPCCPAGHPLELITRHGHGYPPAPVAWQAVAPQPPQAAAANSYGPLFIGQQMTPDTAKIKCKNFLATLLRLASDQPESVERNVRALIQGLIDGRVEPEVFTTKLQEELNSSPQPSLVPFLQKSLPYLQHSLTTRELTIEGVNPPNYWICDCCVKESIVLSNRYGCTSCGYYRCISCYF